MSDLIDEPIPGENAPEFTVSDLSGAVKRMIEGEFSRVRVRGEVGRVTQPRSGHVYLDLKDDRAVLSGVIWKGLAARLTVQPEEGMEMVATGRLTTFPGQSKYQMVIEDLKPAGMGALMAMLETRKKMLAGEGLFAPERKQELPYLPDLIGVVTSPTGAVIRDILHRLRDRFPRKVLVWPVAVQGEKCAVEISRAIAGFNAFTPGGALPRPDLIIVARGGGSIEDLWGFNEEAVVRAAAASRIPLISAVGHETDTTLIDFASDRRAPTPTAAAELAVPVRLELLAWLDGQEARLSRALGNGILTRGQSLRDLARGLPRPETLLETPSQRLDGMSDKLGAALIKLVQTRRVALSEGAGALRPALLRRAVEGERRRLANTAARLNLAALRADMARRRRDLDRLSLRMSDAGKRQIAGLGERLSSLERIRKTMGYTETLRRGYAVIRAGDRVVTTRAAAMGAPALEIEFADGKLDLSRPGEDMNLRKPARPRPVDPDQGSLL